MDTLYIVLSLETIYGYEKITYRDIVARLMAERCMWVYLITIVNNTCISCLKQNFKIVLHITYLLGYHWLDGFVEQETNNLSDIAQNSMTIRVLIWG